MAKKEINKNLVIALSVIGVLLVLNVLSFTGFTVLDTTEPEEWACSKFVCDKATTPQDWVQENCYQTPDTGEWVYKVVMEGQEKLVPLNMINQQSLSQCLEARCVQEARVRAADYAVDAQTGENLE